MLKRMSYRRQKRWWNAYMLFYTRLDVEENALMKSLNELSLCKYCRLQNLANLLGPLQKLVLVKV